MAEKPQIVCAVCGAPIAKRDCHCKGEGKFKSSWKLATEVATPASTPALEEAQ
ncbi:MAG TPA: hypothetical protein VHC71_11125 [Hyphomicrobium sp.]|jgi:hypothetical protein|nr:hypothetical protein [Hyphomicrobium sp.]